MDILKQATIKMGESQMTIIQRVVTIYTQFFKTHATSTLMLQMYLIATALLYGIGGCIFLVSSSHLQITQAGLDIVSDRAAILTWGSTELLIAVLQIVCLFSRDLQVWRLTTTFTVAWATAWAATVTYVAFTANVDYGRPLLWWWVDVIHIVVLYTYQLLVINEKEEGL